MGYGKGKSRKFLNFVDYWIPTSVGMVLEYNPDCQTYLRLFITM